MVGRIARGTLLGLLVTLAVGVWPARADLSNVRIISPESGTVVSGIYQEKDGKTVAAGFDVSFEGEAHTDCSTFEYVQVEITKPDPYEYSHTEPLPFSGADFQGGFVWNTKPLRNGAYRMTFQVKEQCLNLFAGKSASPYVDVKVANAAEAPTWGAAPLSDFASDGSPTVTLRWNKNREPDVVEYHIIRTGGAGSFEAAVSASNPEQQDCDRVSGDYVCEDLKFPKNGYDGTYSYRLVAVRSRPAYSSNETQYFCELSPSQACVQSNPSDSRSIALSSPAPKPRPKVDQNPGSGSGTGSGSGSTSVLSSSSRGSGLDGSDFFTGSYKTSLPYQPRTLLIPGASARPPGDSREQAFSGEILTETPPDFRTITLPIAGGLLTFLAAAHVRRLLVDH